jgi:hexosaminidase
MHARLCVLLTAVLLGGTHSSMAQSTDNAVSIIPAPAGVTIYPGQYTLSPDTTVFADDAVQAEARMLAQYLAPATGFEFRVRTGKPADGAVSIALDEDLASSHGPESYTLTVTPQAVTLRAGGAAGAFYGIQTLRQLLPPEIFRSEKVSGVEWTIPCCEILDCPRFVWRGLHLDVSRHFYDVQFIKKYIDLLALYKMNRFHWHLVDSVGWRIEIKKHPELTDIGAWRTGEDFKNWGGSDFRFPGKGSGEDLYGGYYTQEQIRDIVAYAKARHIEILPEIEMPGHSGCALVAHPELTCTQVTPGSDGRIVEHVYCAGKDATFQFLEDVLDETMALFPFVYVHIGGDEVGKDQWKECADCQARMKAEGLKNEDELQSYFIKRIEKYVNSKGRRIIGWEEILQGGLAPDATVMSWLGTQSGVKSARMGHDAIMAPNTYLYLDAYQSDPSREPTTIGYAPNTLSRVYHFEPVADELSPEETKRILGAQGQAWTEWMIDSGRVEYMVYPRACALAEVAWTPKENKDYCDFYDRLKTHARRLGYLHVNYRPLDDLVALWRPDTIGEEFADLVFDITEHLDGPGTYEIEMRYSHGAHGLDVARVEMLAGESVIAADEHEGFAGRRSKDQFYRLDVPEVKPDVPYTVRIRAKGSGGTDSVGEIILRKASGQG